MELSLSQGPPESLLWLENLLEDSLQLTFQNLLLETEEKIREASLRLWGELLQVFYFFSFISFFIFVGKILKNKKYGQSFDARLENDSANHC